MAKVDLPVLIVGQTNVGTKILSRLIHNLSSRRDGPFSVLRCSEFAEDVLEGSLFDVARKDNSGARYRLVGRLEACRGGTLVLD